MTEDEIDQIRPGIAAANAWWLRESAYPYISEHVVNRNETAPPLAAADTLDGFVRLTVGEAMDSIRGVTRATPPGHPLHKGSLTPMAICGRCYRATLFGVSKRFALTLLMPTDGPAELPDPPTELFEDYSDAFAAMQRHATACTGRHG